MSDQMVVSHPVALVDILDRVLARGLVVSGEIGICLADIDLTRVSLRALLASIRVEQPGATTATQEALP